MMDAVGTLGTHVSSFGVNSFNFMEDKHLEAIRELQKILRVRKYQRKIDKVLKGHKNSSLVKLAERLQKI